MEFGRFSPDRRVLAFFVLLSTSPFQVWAQQAPGTSPTGSSSTGSSPTDGVPTLPAAQPIAQAAAAGGAPSNSPPTSQPTKASENDLPANSTAVASENWSLLKLGAGDLLEVSVYNVPELSTKARIGTSGDVYLPLIDYVHLGDLTVEEAQTLIQKRLEDGGFVRNPHVTIFVDESNSQGVTILGDVARPGIYPALGDRRLYDFISAAGGFTASAGRKVSIIRHSNKSEPISVNLPRNLADDPQDNLEVLPGDTITIPRAPIVYVVGDVGHPTGLLVDNGSLTVLQALALAGGTNHTAKMGRTCIIRRGPAGMTETRVPLKKMLEAKAPDITLQADDILFVPLSGVRVAAGTGFNAAVSAAVGLAVIAVH
jgi:polysaccharide export outer membrane protein